MQNWNVRCASFISETNEQISFKLLLRIITNREANLISIRIHPICQLLYMNFVQNCSNSVKKGSSTKVTRNIKYRSLYDIQLSLETFFNTIYI
jgi:hypothetical protein